MRALPQGNVPSTIIADSTTKFSTNTTGSGTPTFSNNSPAVTPGTIYTWVKAVSSDGSIVYWPVWK